jgi:HlyD family secretion protein
MTKWERCKDWVTAHPVWSIIIALAVAAALFFLLKPATPAYEYVTEPVDRGEVVSRVTASGKLRALNTIKVGAEVSGQITDVLVDFNSPVRAGQVLARIDPTRFRARVQQAQAAVALAQAGLLQAEANAARAETDLAIQTREFARRQSLENSGFVSKSGLDTASSQLANARAGVKTTRAQVASARAQISQSNAELTSAQLDLRRTTIVAPAGGVVINKLVEPGTTVAANFQTPNLFEIAADTTRMQVEASVDEADIGQIREGQEVRFTVDAYPDDSFKAVVRQIRKAATEAQNVVSYLVILEVDNQAGKLLPGMTANVEVITGRKANVLRAPAAALRFRPRAGDRPEGKSDRKKEQVPTVWRATGEPYEPEAVRVKTGLVGEDFVEVLGGVKAGDELLVRSRSLEKKEVDPEEEDDADDPTP